jgi:predicted nucleic acid-binding protein
VRDLLRDDEVAAPYLVDSEVISALRGMVRRGEFSVEDAGVALHAWKALIVFRVSAPATLERIWALRDTVTAYDATYIALAERLGCPLVTADARLAAAPGIGCPVVVVPR